jgi:hypothetical protein
MDNESRRAFMLISLGQAAFGVIFLAIGIVLLRCEAVFARTAVEAQGVVVGHERRRVHRRTSRGRRGRAYDFPVVRYTTHEGQEVQFESSFGTSPRFAPAGQQVQVLYNPADPSDARIASGCMRYGLPLVFVIIGLGMLLLASIFGAIAWSMFR